MHNKRKNNIIIFRDPTLAKKQRVKLTPYKNRSIRPSIFDSRSRKNNIRIQEPKLFCAYYCYFSSREIKIRIMLLLLSPSRVSFFSLNGE